MRDHNRRHTLDKACDPVDGQICIGTDKGKPPMTSRFNRSKAYAAAAITAALTLGLTACGGSDNGATGDPTTTPTSTAPTTSAPPTPKTPQELAQAALESYFTITEKAETSGKLKDLVPLSKVATGDAYFKVRSEVQTYSQNGIRLKGTVGHSLSAATMPNAKTVSFTDCRDESRSKVVDKTGHEIETLDAKGNKVKVPDRYKVDYTVNLIPTKNKKSAWRVTATNYHWDSPC